MAEEIAFDRSLYLPEAVAAAAAAYGAHARIELADTQKAVIARISDVAGHDPAIVVHSFCNHVLHETITRRRQPAP